ncbi:MAG: hypothetical protein A3A86_04275 [Elusimicrobia bacterium RIFCSPLOWO2_01_FULL_60_11]|nr:MAG: hypothetical protein A3A86_04275 [Elusimicrobia bacterium RIFCSPLOWO2_01_FULL_60_11]
MNKEIMSHKGIESKIFIIRGHKVMLDRDLADLYGVKTRPLRQQVKRNKERFPEDFMFRLTKNETEILVSQFAIPSIKSLGGHLPYAFTEHGAIMIASILNTKRAVQVSIFVVRAFNKIREMLSGHKNILKKLDELEQRVEGHDHHIHSLFDIIRGLLKKPSASSKPSRRRTPKVRVFVS